MQEYMKSLENPYFYFKKEKISGNVTHYSFEYNSGMRNYNFTIYSIRKGKTLTFDFLMDTSMPIDGIKMLSGIYERMSREIPTLPSIVLQTKLGDFTVHFSKTHEDFLKIVERKASDNFFSKTSEFVLKILFFALLIGGSAYVISAIDSIKAFALFSNIPYFGYYLLIVVFLSVPLLFIFYPPVNRLSGFLSKKIDKMHYHYIKSKYFD